MNLLVAAAAAGSTSEKMGMKKSENPSVECGMIAGPADPYVMREYDSVKH